MALGLNKNC